MLFFNKKKKIIKALTENIHNTIKPAFIYSPYLDLNTGKLNVPSAFWTDAYILGFIHTLMALVMERDFKCHNMHPVKKGEIILNIYQNLAKDSWMQALEKVGTLAQKPSEDFLAGQNDASTFYGSSTGIINKDDKDPVYLEAKQMANSMKDIDFFGADSNSNLGACVLQLSLHKHIKENYH
jgi:hypothetical protein